MTDNHTDKGQPLVSFALFAYEHERFIQEAVEGALNQSYSPLEIILSDDCSSDKTFDIMSAMVHDYDGPHKIILNRNTHNLGLIEHVNSVLNMCSGDLVAFAAGDDVSLPERVSTLARYWQKEPGISVISSSYINIDGNGDTIDDPIWQTNLSEATIIEGSKEALVEHIIEDAHSIAGCTEAVVINKHLPFKPIPPETILEDRVFTFRALLLDGILFVPERLVLYRAHENNVFNPINNSNEIMRSAIEKENRAQFVKKHKYDVLNVYLVELTKARRANIIDNPTYKDFKNLLENRSYLLGKQSVWWELRFNQKLAVLINMIRYGFYGKIKWAIIRLMPYKIFIDLRQKRINRSQFAK